MADKIIVLDFGSQYNQLIARRIRDFNVYSQLLPHTSTLQEIQSLKDVKGIIFSGGPHSVYDEQTFRCDPQILTSGIPILGICYGMQMIHHMQEGKVLPCDTKEYGRSSIEVLTQAPLFKDIDFQQIVWMSHGDQVAQLAPGFKALAKSSTCPYAAAYHPQKNMYTLQFHPEVVHTEHGSTILKNFVFEVCHAQNNWTMQNFVANQIQTIKAQVGKDKVLLGLSGGVDSSVVAALLHEAIHDQLLCMFIDHGLLRKNEAQEVMETFAEKMQIKVIKIDARKRFLNKLKGIDDPEEKRKIIGNEFIYTFDDEVKKINAGEQIKYLAQGTLYTDVIESGTESAQTIKSHHNVKGLPKDMQFQLIEPLKTLFKDEVRMLGAELKLPPALIWRQPFPGPGLAIRIIGDITQDKLAILKESDYILREEIKKANLTKAIWQYFTVLTNIRSVGVMGDQRTYDYTIAIRAVTSIDGMSADWARIPYDVLENISNRIVNEVQHVNRVVYDITSKPPATIEWE